MLPRVTEILKPYGPDFTQVPPHILELGQERGTRVDAWCSGYALGQYMLPPEPFIEGYCRSFSEWFDRNVESVWLCKKRLTSKTWGFTGEPDMGVVYKHEGKNVLIDLKTPLGLQPVWDGQLSAYEILIEEELGIKVDRSGSLRLRPDGSPALFHEVREGAECKKAFLHALMAHKYFKGR